MVAAVALAGPRVLGSAGDGAAPERTHATEHSQQDRGANPSKAVDLGNDARLCHRNQGGINSRKPIDILML